MLYIEPGAPWENGFAESFFSRLRDELLNVEEFMNLAEARWFARRRLHEHNEERPHSSLGYRTPSQFAQPIPLGKLNRYSTRTLITPGTKIGGISLQACDCDERKLFVRLHPVVSKHGLPRGPLGAAAVRRSRDRKNAEVRQRMRFQSIIPGVDFPVIRLGEGVADGTTE
jgi:hypothetical protein